MTPSCTLQNVFTEEGLRPAQTTWIRLTGGAGPADQQTGVGCFEEEAGGLSMCKSSRVTQNQRLTTRLHQTSFNKRAVIRIQFRSCIFFCSVEVPHRNKCEGFRFLRLDYDKAED